MSATATGPCACAGYDPAGPCYDEAFSARGQPRAHYRAFMHSLEAQPLDAMGGGMADMLEALGVRFGAEGRFVVDPIPRIIPAAEWSVLEAGLGQRVRALDAFLADVYGPREIVAAGVVPARAIHTAERHEAGLAGVRPPGGRWACVAGLDLVRDGAGRWLVLEDNLRTPSGLAYAAAAREALDGQLAEPPPPARRSLAEAFDLLGAALRAAAPEGCEDPAAVLLTDGPASSAYFEHQWLARRLDLPLVTLNDLERRRGGLVRRSDGRRRPVDVVYRRTDEDRPSDAGGRPTRVGAALLEPWRSGRLGLVNAFGTGVADDKLLHAYAEDMIRFYLGQEPLLGSVMTYDLARPEVRERLLRRVSELVIKPRDGYGGRGILIGPHASHRDRQRMAAAVRARPDAFVAQETVALSRHPTVVAGRLEPRHVDLRPFVFLSDRGASVAPGGLTRVALSPGALVVNSSQAGGAKDTWVLG